MEPIRKGEAVPEDGESYMHQMVVTGDDRITHGSAYDSTMISNTTPNGRRIVTTQAGSGQEPETQKPPAKAN